LDIVGYSKLLADEQNELIQELNQIVRETEQFRAAEAEGKLTRNREMYRAVVVSRLRTLLFPSFS
jgi:hypothetical protein